MSFCLEYVIQLLGRFLFLIIGRRNRNRMICFFCFRLISAEVCYQCTTCNQIICQNCKGTYGWLSIVHELMLKPTSAIAQKVLVICCGSRFHLRNPLLPRRLQWRGVSIKILTIPVPFAPKTSLFGIGSSKTLPVTTEHLLLDGANSVLWNVSHVHVINTYPLPFHSESSHNFLVPADGCFSRGISMRKWPKNVIFNFYHNIAFI